MSYYCDIHGRQTLVNPCPETVTLIEQAVLSKLTNRAVDLYLAGRKVAALNVLRQTAEALPEEG